MASSSSSPMKDDEKSRNWEELPPELTSSILHRLGAIGILENAQKVCRPWRSVCKDTSMWRKIDMRIPRNLKIIEYDIYMNTENLDADELRTFIAYRSIILKRLGRMMCHAVDLSQGGLVEINIERFGTDSLLTYIADRSLYLRKMSSKTLIKRSETLSRPDGLASFSETLWFVGSDDSC